MQKSCVADAALLAVIFDVPGERVRIHRFRCDPTLVAAPPIFSERTPHSRSSAHPPVLQAEQYTRNTRYYSCTGVHSGSCEHNSTRRRVPRDAHASLKYRRNKRKGSRDCMRRRLHKRSRRNAHAAPERRRNRCKDSHAYMYRRLHELSHRSTVSRSHPRLTQQGRVRNIFVSTIHMPGLERIASSQATHTRRPTTREALLEHRLTCESSVTRIARAPVVFHNTGGNTSDEYASCSSDAETIESVMI